MLIPVLDLPLLAGQFCSLPWNSLYGVCQSSLVGSSCRLLRLCTLKFCSVVYNIIRSIRTFLLYFSGLHLESQSQCFEVAISMYLTVFSLTALRLIHYM